MAYEAPAYKIPGQEAAADLSAKQYYFVKVTAANRVNLSGDGEAALGVLQNKPDAAGKAAEVVALGVSKVVASAVIAVGAEIASTATGKAVTAGTGKKVRGIALEAAAADNNIISAYIYQGETSA